MHSSGMSSDSRREEKSCAESTGHDDTQSGDSSQLNRDRGARRHSLAIRLSRVDRERLERGDISEPTQALHLNDTARTREKRPSIQARDANERRLLEDRPPHFGAL